MSQVKEIAEMPAPLAIVGKSALFPVALAPRIFWPQLIGLKGLIAGLATSQWPFSDFFSTQQLKNLKGFFMNSGLLSAGSLPADGFEIPPDVLEISSVMPVLGLFLAKQALDDVRSFQKGTISADRVRVALETRFSHQTPPVKSSEDTVSKAPPTSSPGVAETFARHFGFSVSPVNVAAPLPGAISWLGTAIRELQSAAADLVIAGCTDAVHSVLAWIGQTADSSTAEQPLCEGLGMIALRRLSDAERDGDQILAVISGCDASSIKFVRTASAEPLTPPASLPASSVAPVREESSDSGPGLAEKFARFARLPAADIVLAPDGSCRNLPFNSLPEAGSDSSALAWKLLREGLIQRTGSRRFFHDLLGALLGTFVNRVVIQNPTAFAAVSSSPVVFLANHQIGLESPLFMTLTYSMTGLPVEAVAKPDHINAWLSFLLAFAEESLGKDHPFRLMFADRQNPQALLDSLKKPGKQEASLLVHVEGTRAASAGQPVTRMSSVFIDMAIEKNLPLVPLRFAGGLPAEPSEERYDFPFKNGRQDFFIGAPVMPEQLKKMPYGQRPRFLMELINTLGPGKGQDMPLPPDKKFEAKTRFFVETFGFPKMQAMLFAILQMIDDPCEETALLIKAVQSGKVDPQNPGIPPALKSFLGHIKTKFS